VAKLALVLSGGGATGAFQVAAEQVARRVLAEKHDRNPNTFIWDIVAGVSIGALNGTMIAMGAYPQLEAVWMGIEKRKLFPWPYHAVYRHLPRMLAGQPSIYPNRRIWKLIDEEIKPEHIKSDLRIGSVSLVSGRYVIFRSGDLQHETFKRALLAACAIPGMWPPVHVNAEYRHMVDGGLRNLSPLADVLDAGPDEVVVINCATEEISQMYAPPRSIFDLWTRTMLEITMNEIIVTDTRELLRINAMVRQAEAQGIVLAKPDGTPYKAYNVTTIQPTQPLETDHVLNFSQKVVDYWLKQGSERAKAVYGIT
jgi:NTE family protein